MGILDAFRLDHKRAVVTGGGNGIGKRVAETLAELGADVAILDVDHDRAQTTAEEIREKYGVRTMGIRMDVTKEEDAHYAMEAVAEELGGIDIVLNNAGISYLSPIEDFPLEQYEKVMKINLTGVLLTAREAAKIMIRQGTGGVMINTASICGHIISYPRKSSAYCISKAGVLQMTKAMAVEWAPHGIRVNSISPGYVYTDMIKNSEVVPVWEAHTALGRLAEVDDLMGAFAFLASDASRYMTGADIQVDGGYMLR